MSPDLKPERQQARNERPRPVQRDSTYNPLTRLAPLLYAPEELTRDAIDQLWKRVHAAKKP